MRASRPRARHEKVRQWRRCFSLIGLVMLAGLATARAEAAPPRALVDRVRAQARDHGFDGVILIGEKDGSSAHFATVRGLDRNAVWRWASITKQLLATIAMQEVAAGRLDLDASPLRYWPEWKALRAREMRIRDLLLHQSGLPQPDESQPDADGVPAFYRAAAASPAASAAGFCAGPERAKPPARFEYNNCDSIVLAEIVARVAGKPFPELLRDRLGRPLGMASLGLFAADRAARSHVRPVGEFSDIDRLVNLGVYGASGGAYGTIRDLWRFDRALLKGTLVPEAQRAMMWESDKQNGFYGFHQWIYPASLAGCSAPVRIVERQGLIGGIELRNFLLPESGRALLLFSRKRPTNLGDPGEGKGFAFDLLSQVACRERVPSD